jgi:hypothetical protein
MGRRYYIISESTSGSFQYSLNDEGLLMQSSPTPSGPSPFSSSARILTYHKDRNVADEKVQEKKKKKVSMNINSFLLT